MNKKGRLTPEEWEHVRGHPAHSDRWIGGLTPWLGEWVLAASQHHERFDGQGYPYGIAGMDISLAGRIVSVADAFDVMTAARSYKKPFPAAQARVELTDNAGSQFDPADRPRLPRDLGRRTAARDGSGRVARGAARARAARPSPARSHRHAPR